MAAPLGNEYWKLRSRHGRDTEYTPDELFNEANKYFEFCQTNPLQEEQIVKYKESYEKVGVSKMRPFTIQGLCNYLEISEDTFANYSKKEDFIGITTRIRQIIYNQKFEGAAAGFLNPNIIARDLGLVDKKEVDNKPSEIDLTNLTDDELIKLTELQKKAHSSDKSK